MMRLLDLLYILDDLSLNTQSVLARYEMKIIVDVDDKTFDDDLIIFADHSTESLFFVSGLHCPLTWFEDNFNLEALEILYKGDDVPEDLETQLVLNNN